jgi:hypothetical protein
LVPCGQEPSAGRAALQELRRQFAKLPVSPQLNISIQPSGTFAEQQPRLSPLAHRGRTEAPVLWLIDPFHLKSAPENSIRLVLPLRYVSARAPYNVTCWLIGRDEFPVIVAADGTELAHSYRARTTRTVTPRKAGFRPFSMRSTVLAISCTPSPLPESRSWDQGHASKLAWSRSPATNSST